jgi:hypothetical protein
MITWARHYGIAAEARVPYPFQYLFGIEMK